MPFCRGLYRGRRVAPRGYQRQYCVTLGSQTQLPEPDPLSRKAGRPFPCGQHILPSVRILSGHRSRHLRQQHAHRDQEEPRRESEHPVLPQLIRYQQHLLPERPPRPPFLSQPLQLGSSLRLLAGGHGAPRASREVPARLGWGLTFSFLLRRSCLHVWR